MPAPVDRRVSRTRAVLLEAMVGLMVERGWEGVSVQALCERANVGRSTFYLHFNGKEELLSSSLDGLRQHLRASRGGADGRLGFVHGLVEHVYENHRLFRALVGRRSGQIVHDRFRKLIVELTREELAERDLPRVELVAHYLAGALSELLTWAVDRARPLDAAEVEETFHELSAAALARAQAALR